MLVSSVPNSNEYMRIYMANRRANRLRQLNDMLGGVCARCGSCKDLQFDHIDHTSKSFQLSGRGLDKSWASVLLEAKKCQLLCQPCHVAKTATERAVQHGGGLTGKKNCYCELCKPLKQAYFKENRYKWGR